MTLHARAKVLLLVYDHYDTTLWPKQQRRYTTRFLYVAILRQMGG